MYNGNPGEATYTNGIQGTPVYAAGSGWQSEAGGMYQLSASSPGYGKGAKIANFNDGVAAPDVGAHQSGTPAMRFGVAASSGSAVGGAPVTSTPPPTSPPPATTTPGLTADKYSLTFSTSTPLQAVRLTNTTSSTVTVGTVTSSSARFIVRSGCSALSAGQTCTLSVIYASSASGSNTGTVSVQSSAGSVSIAVGGGGAVPPTPTTPTTTPPTTSTPTSTSGGVMASATSLTFGTTSTLQRVVLRNNTTTKVSVLGAVVTGSAFRQASNCSTLAPGATCVATIYFTAVGGPVTGSIVYSLSSPNAPITISVKGG